MPYSPAAEMATADLFAREVRRRKELEEKINKVISRIHTGDARDGWGSNAAMEIFEILTGNPYP